MIRYALNHADHVISVCDALRQEIITLGTNDDKTSVIPSGVDTERFYPIDKREARAKLSIANKKIVLSVGSLIPLKGFHVILDALFKLLQEDTNIHLYIVGEGPYHSTLEKKIENLKLDQHVTLVGQRPNDELGLWYSAADVFCLASFREGWANVIMESLACGTPVVATRVGGTPEILNSPDIGILTDPTPESLQIGLQGALGMTWDRKQIRAYMENRTWSNIAREIKAVFQTVCEQRVWNIRKTVCP